jgi:hypothetical protein
VTPGRGAPAGGKVLLAGAAFSPIHEPVGLAAALPRPRCVSDIRESLCLIAGSVIYAGGHGSSSACVSPWRRPWRSPWITPPSNCCVSRIASVPCASSKRPRLTCVYPNRCKPRQVACRPTRRRAFRSTQSDSMATLLRRSDGRSNHARRVHILNAVGLERVSAMRFVRHKNDLKKSGSRSAPKAPKSGVRV